MNGRPVRDALTPDAPPVRVRPRYPSQPFELPFHLYMLSAGRRYLLSGPDAAGGLLLSHLSLARGAGVDVLAAARMFYILDCDGAVDYALALE